VAGPSVVVLKLLRLKFEQH